jgi:hypothetical protein
MKSVSVSVLLFSMVVMGAFRAGTDVSGTFSPVGPPSAVPVRVGAGPSCIIDLTQRYEVTGDLAGGMEIDYRILVQGPCGASAGTYHEEWIAHGRFTGILENDSTSATFVYTAEVGDAGEVTGSMVFGGSLRGRVTVSGRFWEGELRYAGDLVRASGGRSR